MSSGRSDGRRGGVGGTGSNNGGGVGPTRRGRPTACRRSDGPYSKGGVNASRTRAGPETRRSTVRRSNDDDVVCCRLVVSNLDYGVSSADIRGLFEEFGPLRTAAVRYDLSGGSRGIADVVYEGEKPALEAMRRYHNAPLDGRFMKIRPVTTDRSWSARETVRTLRGDGGARPARTVRNGKIMKPSFKDELDAQLDDYMKNRNN